jgi:hypothetical protein
MATPAKIFVEGIDYAVLYKHFDGYPSSTLPWLEEFNTKFTENRGEDPQYKFAQLLRSTIREEYSHYGLDDSLYTGWGVMSPDTAWGQYEYILHTDGSVSYKER